MQPSENPIVKYRARYNLNEDDLLLQKIFNLIRVLHIYILYPVIL